MKRICIISSGVLPVPPTQGGAVENLIYFLAEHNEMVKKNDMTIISIFEDSAYNQSDNFHNCSFYFIKPGKFVKNIDNFLFFMTKKILKERALSLKTMCTRLLYIKKIQKYLLKERFDNIILENSTILFRIFKNKKLENKYAEKIIYHAHNEPNGTFGCKNLINKCSKFICVSEFIKKSWMKTYPNTQGNFFVVKNGIDTSKFINYMQNEEKSLLRKKLGINESDFVIIFTGRLSVEKGIIELAKAFAQLQIKNKKLLIVGGSFYAWKNKSTIQTTLDEILIKEKNNVLYAGYVPYNDIWKYYKISDIAVLPSIWKEPAGLTNVEAQLSGLPVITTYTGGIPEYTNPESKMMILPNQNYEQQIKDKIMELYGNKKLRIEIGNQNQDYAIQFSKQNFSNNFFNVIL